MANTFGIPPDIERKLRVRDQRCVYCHKAMKAHAHTRGTPRDKATIEHLESSNGRGTAPTYWGQGLERVGLDGLAICCGSCNSSRGMKPLAAWFATRYCERHEVSAGTVAPVVKRFLVRHPRG